MKINSLKTQIFDMLARQTFSENFPFIA